MTVLLPKSAGGYRSDVGWTGDAKDHDFNIPSRSSNNDSLDTDFLSASEEWVTLSVHSADVQSRMREVLEAVGLQETPLGKALMTAARWHDWGKSVDKWQNAVNDHVAKACNKLDEIGRATATPELDMAVAQWRDRVRSNVGVAELWGKFPDVRTVCLAPSLNLTDLERTKLFRKLAVPFRPGLRHEAASALAAWQSWLAKADGLTALAVYLVACHHGKVRTVLRSMRDAENVFGVTDGMNLQTVPGLFPDPTSVCTDPKYVGACGEFDEESKSFTITSPSWLQMVAELLGPVCQDEPATTEIIPEDEPHALGPLALAYLESLLRAADVRASRQRDKGRKP